MKALLLIGALVAPLTIPQDPPLPPPADPPVETGPGLDLACFAIGCKDNADSDVNAPFDILDEDGNKIGEEYRTTGKGTASHHFRNACVENIPNGERRNFLAPIVAAVRYQENGACDAGHRFQAHREWGQLRDHYNTYRDQAGAAAYSANAEYERFKQRHPNKPEPKDDPASALLFIQEWANRYCPESVDPTGYAHWIHNVPIIHNQILIGDPPGECDEETEPDNRDGSVPGSIP